MEETVPATEAVTAASSSYSNVPPELLPTPFTVAEALWSVEMPPGLDTSMVTSRTILLPGEHLGIAGDLAHRAGEGLKGGVQSHRGRLPHIEGGPRRPAGKGTVRVMVSELRMVATCSPAATSSPTSTSRV